MAHSNAASEWLRLTTHYRRMSDGELVSLARDPSALTEAAQQVLKAEFSARRLDLPPPDEPASPPDPEPDPDSTYAEDRELVELCKVWSLSDALQLQWLLDRAGIPFYMGDQRVTGVDKLTSNFAAGVSVKVMRVGYPWARQTLSDYEPADEPPQTKKKRKSCRKFPSLVPNAAPLMSCSNACRRDPVRQKRVPLPTLSGPATLADISGRTMAC